MSRARTAAAAMLAGLMAVMLGSLAACGSGPPASAPTPGVTPATPAPPTSGPEPSPAVSIDSHAPAGFVDLSDVDSTILTDIRYHGAHNFVGRPIDGYLEPRCLLTDQAAQALRRAQAAAVGRGYSLKVYDCYRPSRAGVDFERWAQAPNDEAMRPEFFPTLTKRQLFTQGFVGGGRTSHSQGSTVDLTMVPLPASAQRPFVPGEPLVACTAPVGDRFPDNTADMGTGFDCFDFRSHTLNPNITGAARENRLLLRQIMADAGFVNYSNEWWHFDLADNPYPDTYFDFPVAHAAVS
jgi:D-alanyl-D-alanine dipeptidase